MKFRGRGAAELIDPDGEGIYLLSDWAWDDNFSYLLAAQFLGLGWREWREVKTETAWMRPSEPDYDGGTWIPADIGKHPRGWRLNLPRRWRPVCYLYCTPKVEIARPL